MDNIIYHNNYISQTTFPTHLTGGSVNPLRRISYNQIININSRFRDDYYITPSTNFFVSIPGLPSKITSMKLVNITLPKFIYTVNHKTGSDNFYIKIKYHEEDSYKCDQIFINSGSYSGEEIVTAITDAINKKFEAYQGTDRITALYNKITGKICFNIKWHDNNNSHIITEVILCFNYIEPSERFKDCNEILTKNFCKNDEIFSQKPNSSYEDQLTLGWLLGFRGNYVYKTPKVANTIPTNGNDMFSGKFLTDNILSPQEYTFNQSQQPLSRKELKNLSNITPSRARLTKIKDNGMQYLEQTYKCCDPSGLMFEPLDISFCYTIQPHSNIVQPHIVTTDQSCNFFAESIYDPIGNRYFLLSVNDFQNNHTKAIISPMQDEALQDSHILAKVNSTCCDDDTHFNSRIYFGPVNINRLHIKLLDEFGRIVDLNNGDFSFSLELEILYDL